MVCNEYATRGIHVSALRDRGDWYCRAHFEMTPAGQQEIAARMRAMMEGDDG